MKEPNPTFYNSQGYFRKHLKKSWMQLAIITCFALIMLCAVLYSRHSAQTINRYYVRKVATQGAVNDMLQAITQQMPSGNLIYIRYAEDAKCTSESDSWFGSTITCIYVGKLLYRGNQTTCSLQSAEALLAANGYKNSYLNVFYGNGTSIALTVFDSSANDRGLSASNIFGLSKPIQVKNNELLCGFTVRGQYYEDSGFAPSYPFDVDTGWRS